MTPAELETQRDRIEAELARHDQAAMEARWSRAKAAALDARLRATIDPTAENRAAAAATQAEWQAIGLALETGAAHARHLEAALARVAHELKSTRRDDQAVRKLLAAAEIRERMNANAGPLREMLIDAATLLAVQGSPPTEGFQVMTVIEQTTGLQIRDLFRESRGRATAALARVATQNTEQQEDAPCR